MSDNINKPPKPVVLCILDGWGHADPGPNNAISLANTPNYDRWWQDYPHAFLKTSGVAVGLPKGQMGNSEVGHMNIGAGRVVKQDLPRIDEAIANGTLDSNPVLTSLAAALVESKGALHIMGLISPGGVHSHQDHIQRIAEYVSGQGIKVCIHAFMDGRDTPPESGIEFLDKLEAGLSGNPLVSFATVSGRYYAMDRDQRWERVKKAFQAICKADGVAGSSAVDAVKAAYSKGETDEFITPAVIGEYSGLHDGDAIFMANFRADRAREILTTLVDPDFNEFDCGQMLELSAKVGMVEYSTELNSYMQALFPPEIVKNGLGELVANSGMSQLRIAETEKYAHVTFFFNGGNETKLKGEDRILVPSPKVATYDLKPEMSAHEVTSRLISEIETGKHDFIVINFANPDMVGHTGKITAAIKAVEVIDSCLGEIEKALIKQGGVMLMTADHGNIEQMMDPTTTDPHTAHTTFDVPVFLVGANSPLTLNDGSLSDIAPTLLAILDLPQPKEMTGKNLMTENQEQ